MCISIRSTPDSISEEATKECAETFLIQLNNENYYGLRFTDCSFTDLCKKPSIQDVNKGLREGPYKAFIVIVDSSLSYRSKIHKGKNRFPRKCK